MSGGLLAGGHIGWTPFAVLIYCGVAVLVIDYVWRRVTMPAWLLLAAGVAAWGAGLALLLALS
ncbi:hypothetical protein [Salinisphaera sp.]|uniref:hypothetical protein n=1 Tax=Salinisphaera sp. TaxID=1914330 RepID=UPI002D77380D|nr:hypothetical protein [Salinisphaera sp.]HET7315658.1 hypothetical protein [Salinisphaera sp.]